MRMTPVAVLIFWAMTGAVAPAFAANDREQTLRGAARVVGAAHVVDGDSLEVGGGSVRLFGIDAPEAAQTCAGWPARCRAGDADLGAAMVGSGLAFAYRYFSLEYGPAEDAARRAKEGVWAHACQSPRDWRRAHPRK